MTTASWIAIALAGGVALASPLAFRPLLNHLGVLDVPNGRSSHSKPTLRGGGIGPLLGIAAGGALAVVTFHDPMDARMLALVCVIGIATGIVGLTEDLRGLRIAVRAGAQLFFGGALMSALAWSWSLSWWWVPVAAFGFAAYVNFANFMDGVNGISSLHGLVAGLAYACLGWMSDTSWLIAGGLLVAVAFWAFLPWNLMPPGMFLGDVGSYLLGGTLAALAVAGLASGIDTVAALAPLSIYLVDAISTLMRRATSGLPLFQAHRSHTYQRLTTTGLSHMSVAAVAAGFTAAASIAGIAATADLVAPWAASGILLALAGTYLLLPRLRGAVAIGSAPGTDLEPVALPAPTKEDPLWAPGIWAVIGATGFIGAELVQHLEGQGHTVRPVKAPRVTLAPDNNSGKHVAALAKSADEATDLAAELAGVDVVVNAAGVAAPDAPASADLYGANALLPAIVAHASRSAGARRVVHLSSAAVQGQRQVLDESLEVEPFSAYSRSKALGERAFIASSPGAHAMDLLIVRATSVQGQGRRTTAALRKIARTPLASVAAPGTQPSVVSSVRGLTTFIEAVGLTPSAQPAVQLQPWEGLSAVEVLELAGGKPPRILPVWLCRLAVACGRIASSLVPRLGGLVRRAEVMWFGQAQRCPAELPAETKHVRAALQEGRS